MESYKFLIFIGFLGNEQKKCKSLNGGERKLLGCIAKWPGAKRIGGVTGMGTVG
jgi:hypothetical protein